MIYRFRKGCNYEIHLTKNESHSYKGIAFLDRDGVIIKEKIYIKDPNDVELNPGIEKVLKYLNNSNYKVIIITNQSGIARKYFDWNQYLEVTNQMLDLLGNNIKINSIYACGAETCEECTWRKPGTGMIEQSCNDNILKIKNSILIGDKASDIEAGIQSNIKNLFHILTGHGEAEKEKVNALIKSSEYISTNDKNSEKLFYQLKNLNDILVALKKII